MLKFFYYAIFRPQESRSKFSPVRDILRWPILFDLVSLSMQLLDEKRTKKITDSYAVDDPHHRLVQDYNASVTLTKRFTRTRRVEEYYGLVCQPVRNKSSEQLLIVGPRNIHELFIAWLHGFSWANIHAIDLYSTNDKIKIMNMEEMSFQDCSFDVVVMANTLSYAADTNKVISEVFRVLRPDGRFVFSATFDPGSPDYPGDKIRGRVILEMLQAAGFEIHYHLAKDKINSRGRHQTSHTFGAHKLGGAASTLDPLDR
jgi:hypothetical protein